jgi:8-oxo-dGTP pyrophosphatase MutT (NUDIX family)
MLLQLRDDRPEIGAPGHWGTLGGHMEAGETPEETARRELLEECGQALDVLVPAGHGDGPSLRQTGAIVRSHIFGARVAWTLDDLIVNEGQGLDWFLPEQVRALRLSPAIRPAIE